MNIEDYRRRIDALDVELVRLLNERAQLAQDVGHAKDRADTATFAPHREQAVFERIAAASQGPLSAEVLRAIYIEIISACRALERPLTVAYWGPRASNTHVAARRRFGAQAKLLCTDSIAAVFSAVERSQADFGVVPVENSTEGVVSPTLDKFLDSHLRVCAETYVRIQHNLLSNAASLDEVKRIYTMWQATGQCRQWLATHLPDVEQVQSSTTAKAAEIAAGEPGAAAIANPAAAAEYGLGVLAEHIEDNPQNRTRFWVIGNVASQPTGKDKTSVLFSVPHEAGALVQALSVFDRHGVSLTLIETRPTKQRPWEYFFFVDALGHVDSPDDASVAEALADLKEHCLSLKVLGSYTAAE